MANHHRVSRTVGVLSALSALSVISCRNATICEPTSAGLGQVITSGVSDAYLAEVDKSGADIPHLACKAETTIYTAKMYVRESEDAVCDSRNCLRQPWVDYRVMSPRSNARMSNVKVMEGELRVLGIGKGVALEDCNQIAMNACNEGVSAYYRQQRAVRPPTIQCRLADYQTACEPGGRKPRVIAAAPPPEPVHSAADSRPATWIERLADAKSRPVAIRALIHFFDDAMARSNQNLGDPAVKSVLDQIIEPMTSVYVETNLERGTRIRLIAFLGDTRDPRAGRAWIHACHGFATGAGPDEEDVLHASRAMGATRYDEGAPALGEAFAKLEAGSPKGATAAKNVSGAMLQLKSASWKPVLLEKIGGPMERPPRSTDAEKMAAYQTQLFWQQTSADLLGTLGDASATKPLLKVLLEKEKAEIAGVALLGIVKIGAGAVPILVDVLAGKDVEMVDFSTRKSADGVNAKSYVAASAVALGAIGRVDARSPLIQALKSADNEVNRAVVARELAALPASTEAEKAFQAAFDKVPSTTSIWPSVAAARPALLTAAARFYDAALVPWLLTQANAAKGKDEETMGAALASAINVMKNAHVVKVKTVVDRIGSDKDKSAFAAASELLGKCAEDVDCYLAKLTADDSSGFVGVKAAHMVAMLGDTRAGMEIVKLIPTVRNAEVRAAAVLAVDHVVQKDSGGVADALQKLLDDHLSDGPGPLATTAAEHVVYRLRAR